MTKAIPAAGYSTFLETFEELSSFIPVFRIIEYVTLGIFCIEYILRIWTSTYLYPDSGQATARLRFLISFDGIVDLLTIVPMTFLSGFIIFRMLRVARIFGWKDESDYFFCIYCIDTYAGKQPLYVQCGAWCSAGCVQKRFQRNVVEYVHPADSGIRWYLSNNYSW